MGLGHDRALRLRLGIGVEIDNDPIIRLLQFMRSLRVGEEHGELPCVAARVQDGKPSLARRIETLGSDLAQLVLRRLHSIFPIHVQQQRDRRSTGLRRSLEVTMTEAVGQRALDGECAARADALHLLKAAIVGGLLQLLQRIGIELVVDAGCKLRSDARNSLE